MRRTGSHEQGYTDALFYTHAQVYRLGKRFASCPLPSFAMLPSGSSKHGLRASRQNIRWGRKKWGRGHRRGGSGSGANTTPGANTNYSWQRVRSQHHARSQHQLFELFQLIELCRDCQAVEMGFRVEMGWGLMEKTGWSEAGGGGGSGGDLGRCPT